jgi:hypothetical protein
MAHAGGGEHFHDYGAVPIGMKATSRKSWQKRATSFFAGNLTFFNFMKFRSIASS